MPSLSSFIEGAGTSSPGKILQIQTGVVVNNSAHIASTSTSLVTTGLSATITPRESTSKIVVEFIMTMYRSASNGGLSTAVHRSGDGLTTGFIVDRTTSYASRYYHGLSYDYGGAWGCQRNVHVDTDHSTATGAITYTMYYLAWDGVIIYPAHQGHQIYMKLTEIKV